MATIVAVNGSSGTTFQTEHGAHHYRLTGLELMPVPGQYAYDIVRVGLGDELVDSDLPNNIQIDHIYIHADPVYGAKRGIAVNGKAITVSDSYISNIVSTWQDSQAICGWNGPGPITIVNNYLEAGAENIMFGGSPTSMPNIVPSNITVRGNYLYKPPSWHGTSYVMKNLFELKNGRNVLVENNIMDGVWGYMSNRTALVFTPRTEGGLVPWAAVDTITIRYNIIRNADRIANVVGQDDQNWLGTGTNFVFQNNVMEKLNDIGFMVQQASNLRIDHNTIIANVGFLAADRGPTTGLVFTNNVMSYGVIGSWGSGTAPGYSTLSQYFPGYTFANNALLDGQSNASLYPSGNFFPSTAQIGFTNFAGGDYRLTASSPYLTSGTDGKPLGADINTLLALTADVVSGRPSSSIIAPPTPPPPTSTTPPTGTASFVKLDSATKGQWLGNYGADGYVVVGDQSRNPSYVTPVPVGQESYTWGPSTSDGRALQKASNPADRVAATWYTNARSFSIDLNFTDTATHQVALYCVDWDSTYRRQTIDILDANDVVLNSQSLSTPFNGGAYLVWNVSGHVKARITMTGLTNPIVSGIFFGNGSATAAATATATFVKFDTTTQGQWRGVYGADGYTIANDQSLNPSYVTPVPSGANPYTWLPSTAEVRGLQKASDTSDRIAATWFSTTPSFTVDLNFKDSATHQIAVYCLDWDSSFRRQTVEVLDANNVVLNSQSLNASFWNGVYLVWNVSGHVKLRVTMTGYVNPVISGIFFGGPSQAVFSGPSARFLKMDTTTKGQWRGVYGLDGYTVVGDQTVNPAYVSPLPSGQASYTWENSTADIRALQKPSNPADRIAGTWFSTWPSFTIDLPFTDQAVHQVAVYCVDWDNTVRRQTLDVLDASGNVLDSRNLDMNFNQGVYLVWNLAGAVKLRTTMTGGINPIVSGLFFR